MRFVLFGDEPVALDVARAIAAHPEHRLIGLVAGPGSSLNMPVLAAGMRCYRNWEELLADADVDAVVVSGAGPEKQLAVRQLIEAGKVVLLPPELTQPAEFFYELALVESENPGRLFPLLGLRGHPLVVRLRERISQNALGKILHVQIERKIAASRAEGGLLLASSKLNRALLSDADLLRTLCGAYDQVTALRSGDVSQGYSLATVTLAGSAAPQAVWTAAAGTEDGWRLTLSGQSATVMLEGQPESGRLRLTEIPGGKAAVPEEFHAEGGAWLLETFDDSVAAGSAPRKSAAAVPDQSQPISLWEELARGVELVDAVERSVRRRRTIDVYFESPSERSMFKTHMTAVGCSLLVLTLLAVVVYLVLANAIVLPPLLKKTMVGVIFLPLGVFLLLQLLLFVARPAARDAPSDSAPGRE